MATDDIYERRTVNNMLGEKPALGPIPGDQLVPWSMIGGLVIGIKMILNLHWLHAGMMLVWGIATWWLLTGKRAWRFLSRFHRRPRWVRAVRYYESPLAMGVEAEKKRVTRTRSRPSGAKRI